MLRDVAHDMTYLINKGEWGYQKFNSAIHIGMEHNYRYSRGVGTIVMNFRTSAFTKDYDFSAITLNCVNKNDLGRININTRVFAQAGFGNNIPSESSLYVAGANNEELMDNKYTRSIGFVPNEWSGYGSATNHFVAGGGLNLRGYSGYLLPEANSDGTIRYNYKGISGAAFNTEIEFGELFKFMNFKFLKNSIKMQPYIFGDAGVINTNYTFEADKISDLMFDAGVGTTFSIVKWGPFYGVAPLTIRFDMPLFINRLPYSEKDHFQFRWMIGINKAF